MYQVYALKCGERDTTACEFFYREPSHERITLHYFVWLILGGPHPVLVDTGFDEEDAAARGLRGYVSPAAMVGRARRAGGRDPAGPGDAPPLGPLGRLPAIPGAEFWVQRDEVAFWTGPIARYDAYKMSAKVPALRRARTAQLREPRPHRRGDPRSAAGTPCPPARRAHRGPPDRLGGDRQGARRAHVRRLALLPERRAIPAGPDHHEPAGDARRLRDDPGPGRLSAT